MTYTLKRKMRGGQIVCYSCPTCGGILESPLEEAGSEQICPTCQGGFVTPGIAELETMLAEERAKEERMLAEQQRREAEKADAARKAKVAAAPVAREAISGALQPPPAATKKLCDNCDGVIGKLETPCIWNQSTVCAACYSRLTAGSSARSVSPAQPPRAEGLSGAEVVGIAVSIVGIAIAMIGRGVEDGPATAFGVVGVLAGLLVFSVGRMMK
jgi:Zn-finger nucleic acid-binding protein